MSVNAQSKLKSKMWNKVQWADRQTHRRENTTLINKQQDDTQRYKLLFQETFQNPEDVITQSFNQEFSKIVLIADGVLSELLVKACYEPSGRFTDISIFVDITFCFYIPKFTFFNRGYLIW